MQVMCFWNYTDMYYRNLEYDWQFCCKIRKLAQHAQICTNLLRLARFELKLKRLSLGFFGDVGWYSWNSNEKRDLHNLANNLHKLGKPCTN